MVVEDGYVDGDYLDDYTEYYAKCFKPYERFCKRLHFFSRTFDKRAFTSLIEKRISKKGERALRKSYLGFAVAKPLPEAVIGRTVLSTFPEERGRRNFPGVREYEASLYGLKLPVESLAFQEQDTVVGGCATSALWSAFQKTCHVFGKEVPTPAVVTELATRQVLTSRAFPSSGLDLHQMCEGIRASGLEPEVFRVSRRLPVVSLIYAYLKAGLPAILAVEVEKRGLHAVTVVGFSLNRRRVRESEISGPYAVPPLAGLRIDRLYAHDDQIGPFSRLTIYPGCEHGPVRFKSTWLTPQRDLAWLDPVYVIIPVYHKIRIKFHEVLRYPNGLTLLFASEGWLHPNGPLRLRWDISLTTVNDFKSDVRKFVSSTSLLRGLLVQSHPRFIWRVRGFHRDIPLFEVLADATDIARSFFPYLVWFPHYGFGQVIRGNVGRRDWDHRVVKFLSSKFLHLFENAVI